MEGFTETNGHGDHSVAKGGWQQVTNVRKQRRQEAKEAKKTTAANKVEGRTYDGDQSVFAALDQQSKERNARIREQKAAAVAPVQSGDEDSDDEWAWGEKREAGGAPAAAGVSEEKEKKPKVKKLKVTVADAASEIDTGVLSTYLADVSTSFPGQPDAQLLRCADYFARAFTRVTSAQFSWQKTLRESPALKTLQLPLSQVPDPVVTITSEWLGSQPAEATSKFALFLLKSALEDVVSAGGSQKGSAKGGAQQQPSKAKVGVLVVLAILLRKRPEALVQQADVIATGAPFQGIDRLPTLIWAFSQVAQADLVAAVQLWVKVLFPRIVGPTANPHTRDLALLFMETVILANTKKARSCLTSQAVRKGERLVPPRQLVELMRASYPKDAAKTKASERLAKLYPLLKEVALAGSVKAAKPVAAALLRDLLISAGDEPTALSNEAASLFVWAISRNADCFKQWETYHMEHLAASTRILSYINRNWSACSGHLQPVRELRATVRAMEAKHKEALEGPARGNRAVEGPLRAADAELRRLKRRLSVLPSCPAALATLAVCVAMGYGMYLLGPEQNPWGWNGALLMPGGLFNDWEPTGQPVEQ